jgi:cycloeucalenol cycloisomerase
MAYTVGSAFYAIYFIVSFPAYFLLDEPGKVVGAWYRSTTPLRDAAVSALATGMAVLMLLDLGRLAVGAPLQVGGKFFEVTGERK